MKPDECADPRRQTALLGTLSQRQQEIIRLRLVVGLSARETGERLGMAPAAVRLAQHHALDHLRAALRAAPKI
jgi:RNA polymerase sigma-70 factor, ECF subfamily